MKTVILALLVFLVVSQGEALRCNCGGSVQHCSGPVETCTGANTLCGTVSMPPGAPEPFFKGCMEERECKGLNIPGVSSAICCETDLCN